MGDQYDAPNQQVVRADGSAPWEEGSGGTPPGQGRARARTRPAKTDEPTAPDEHEDDEGEEDE